MSSSSSNSMITHFIKESTHLCIPLQDIKDATKNFTTLVIGEGGYGFVYKGELLLSTSSKLTPVAVKRLVVSNISGQGLKQFLTEIRLLSRYKHPNLVSLLGFCEEHGEKILVYDYAERGSLQNYITKSGSTVQLTWMQRINICIDAARGLAYLHYHRVIHRDIKSANILLCHDWKAMIADFGLSLTGHANENVTFAITDASGTRGYCDPEYISTGILTEESDVYSFGVVLFEVLCGRLGFIKVNSEQELLAPVAKRYYEKGRLSEIIDPNLKTEADSDSLNMFSGIAYQCLLDDRERRPSMGLVVQKLEEMMDLYKVSMKQRDISEPKRSFVTLHEKQTENQELLIKCIAQHVGFSGNRPVAACTVYKCLLHWRTFELQRPTLFDQIIQTISHAIEKSQDNNDILAYWLSNASTLLLLLQRTFIASGAVTSGQSGPQRRRSPATLFGRMTNTIFRGAPQGVNHSSLDGNLRAQVEAQYPALLFKKQLTEYVEKMYGMIRDNLKKEISPLLVLGIQRPCTSTESLVKGESRVVNNAAQQASSPHHWQGIMKSLRNFLNTLKTNHVPQFLVRKVFIQLFSFINVQLFNSLLLRRECCSFSNGEYMKAGLAELKDWCYDTIDEYAGSAWDELKHIRQAIGFLVIGQKPKKTFEEISHGLCPVLTVQQLYRISTMYWDDIYGTHGVSPEVISSMRVMMTKENNAISDSFLLDDDSSIPFSVDDSKSIELIDISNVKPPPLIRDNPGFNFLLPRAHEL
uniref:myosin-11-like n=1 Tax=Erigeron canadensis TaxID=72917 RepID=UPI001CB911B0|nr:myosin-11-like [Erigeron canadensis]